MIDWPKVQPAVSFAARNRDRNVALTELAAVAGQSVSQAHRTLSEALGETPKQFTLRLRVDRAAAALAGSRRGILDIALECGFESHEAFCRAFRRRFAMSPSAWRKRGLTGTDVRLHAKSVEEIGPCVGLFHYDPRKGLLGEIMQYKIEKRELTAQPVLVVRRRVRRGDIAAAIGAALPMVLLHAQRRGLALSGYPITRYPEASLGLVTLETGMRVQTHPDGWTAQGEGEVLAETLPGGPAAVTIHSGPYDGLTAAHAAVEEWIEANGLQPSGAPWEAYLNDPADHPNPEDWKTEVCLPLRT